MAKLMFQSPKGVKDVLPEDQSYWQVVEQMIRKTVRLYGFERLDLPIFEETALFQRGVGEGTDIVEKEMYTFQDKGGNYITLRPEFTAGVMRSYLQNGMSSWSKPVKVWSMGPVFRYERPQAGRFRQHTQFNVEALGEMDPALDAEVMSVAWHLYDKLGFQNLNFQINSIGCPQCRPAYLDQLKIFYKHHTSEICGECLKRIDANPLRVLDCKKEICQPIIEKAPQMIDFLCDECRVHFETLKKLLDDLNNPYVINHRLVRGLDYYTKTVFEVWAEGIGAQNAVCGGGRYDGLAEIIGGPPTPAVGFASGIERIVMTLKHQGIELTDKTKTQIYFAYMGEKAKIKIISLISEFRQKGFESLMGFGDRSLKAQMREANRTGARFTVVLGDEEVDKQEAQVKDMKKGEQQSVPLKNLINTIEKEIAS
jgi:histidyl-tRNA synthetase